MLKQTASKSTAVSCHWIRSRARSQFLWVVGNKSRFNLEGVVPVNTTQVIDIKMDEKKMMNEAVYANTKMLSADDVAEAIFWTVNCPPHMNINRMEIMPTVQSFAAHPIARSSH